MQTFIVVAVVAIVVLAREAIRARRSEKLSEETIESLVEDIEARGRMEISLRSEIKHQQELNTRLNADWTATSAALANEQAKTVQLQESIRTLGLQVETRDDTIEKLTAEVAELRDAKQAIVASRWSDDGCGD